MPTRVLKFGGASLAKPQDILDIAAQIKVSYQNAEQLVLVVSAMGNSTNELIAKAAEISLQPDRRELDMLISTGERVSMALMSMALIDMGVPAISFTGSQAGILTTRSHTGADIIEVRAERVREALAQGKVVVLAGFQGVCPESKEITTLGRGGTDTTAVAMADYLQADTCEMYKDVDGIFNADPKLIAEATAFRQLSYPQLLSMTEAGAKIVHTKAVRMAAEKNVRLWVRRAHDPQSRGTEIFGHHWHGEGVFALNHSPCVYEFAWQKQAALGVEDFARQLQEHLQRWNFPDLQILALEEKPDAWHFLLRGTDSNLDFFVKAMADDPRLQLRRSDLSELSLSHSNNYRVDSIYHPGLYQLRRHTTFSAFIVKRDHSKDIAQQLKNFLNRNEAKFD